VVLDPSIAGGSIAAAPHPEARTATAIKSDIRETRGIVVEWSHRCTRPQSQQPTWNCRIT
jgi:hypothetical protein